MRDLNELNINEGGRPVFRRVPTDEEIGAFESHFNLRLPPDYVSFLKQTNGGHPEIDSFRPSGAEEDTLWSVNRFYHLSPEKDDLEGLWRAKGEWQGVLGDRVVPIANDSGGNQILLDYSSGSPTVGLCIHDDDFRMLHLSDTFSSFLDMLVRDPEIR
ncbi:SMI1/KNR4 family protein [Singulisphaera sp. Ch08]|uniref:SMI1/KNR4 family protein n=1 Tax=Singulisphaera sp. Ch08 TaxID=3120278 RepID=A0AAU7CR37_9BACT